MPITIASWNINSINIRLPQIINLIDTENIDILGVQETKVPDANFPIDALNNKGFHVFFNGQKSFNGTAFISKQPLTNCRHHLPGMEMDYQRRFLQAQCNDTLLINCYVPNGKAVGDEKYDYKLRWLDALIAHLEAQLKQGWSIILMGDFNIAPTDDDVYDAQLWRDKILCSAPERQRFQALIDLGFCDTFRQFNQQAAQFSWWDYRDGGFEKNQGHRIDFILSSAKATPYCVDCVIEKKPRSWERPSDHAPVIATFDSLG